MKAITKGNEPACLTQHHATAHSSYQNYAGIDALRIALVAEQRGRCCYCKSRIVVDRQKMKIQHWQSQSDPATQHLQLAFGNLLGACKGGEGGSSDQQHCDTRKGSHSQMWNPATPAHVKEARIQYQNNGEIHADNPQCDDDLDAVLGLNISVLKNGAELVVNRKPNKAKIKAKIAIKNSGVGEFSHSFLL